MGGQLSNARKHFLAAAHLELVLAGDIELARRSRISAASCFWRAGEIDEAQAIFDNLCQAEPQRAGDIQEVIDDLKTL